MSEDKFSSSLSAYDEENMPCAPVKSGISHQEERFTVYEFFTQLY